MEHHPPHTPVDDPFFGPVRRRHPDVDLVLLDPPAPAAAGDATRTPVPDASVEAALGRVRAAARDLLPADPPPRLRLRHGPEEGGIVPEARWTGRRHDGPALLAELRTVLGERGRPVRVEGAALVRLTAPGDPDVVATWAPGSGAVVVTLSGALLPVGRERARVLVRGRD